MEDVAKRLNDIIGGLTQILIGAIGLLVVVQVVFGAGADGSARNIIGNITGVIDGFVGTDASLASLVALLIILGILSRK